MSEVPHACSSSYGAFVTSMYSLAAEFLVGLLGEALHKSSVKLYTYSHICDFFYMFNLLNVIFNLFVFFSFAFMLVLVLWNGRKHFRTCSPITRHKFSSIEFCVLSPLLLPLLTWTHPLTGKLCQNTLTVKMEILLPSNFWSARGQKWNTLNF